MASPPGSPNPPKKDIWSHLASVESADTMAKAELEASSGARPTTMKILHRGVVWCLECVNGGRVMVCMVVAQVREGGSGFTERRPLPPSLLFREERP